ncbi:MAG TPA: LysR family transcriptional regulator [Alphaproteobacteria bacterium]|nr:LysR family transcriptional regulator [Alphaproteobacteria bacterium]
MDWDKLRVFHAVASAGSFTKATETLNISQSAISRQINILEDEIGTSLFTRVARGLVLTEAGEALRDTVVNVFGKLAMAQATMEELKYYPRGHIQVATTLAFGSLWLAPRLQEFLDQYPDVQVNLLLKDEEVDLNMREADIGITALSVGGQDLIQSEPVSYRFRIYASRSYLEKYGTPKKPEDLDNHRLIVFGKDMPHIYSNSDWLLKVGAKKQRVPYLMINSGQAIYEATRSGIGISALHKYMVGDDPEVVEILTDIPATTVYRYVVYPFHLANLKRIQVFVDFILKKMKEEEF